MFGEVFTVICALLGIVGLIFLAFWAAAWLRKHMGAGTFGQSRAIRIRECAGIAQDKQLLIVTVGSKTMLLGVTAGSVTKLCDLDEEDIAVLDAPEASAGSGFAQSLKKAFAERMGAKDASSDEDTESKKDGRNEENKF